MEIKLWTLIRLLLIIIIISVTTNAKPLLQEIPNTDKEISLNSNIKNEPNTDQTTSFETTESAENVTIDFDDKIIKVQPTATSDIVAAVRDIHNDSLPSNKSIPDDNLSLIEQNKNDEAFNSPSASNPETFTETIMDHHAEPLLLESSNLVRNLDETVHKMEDIDSNIEIHELGTDSDTLEENIRNSVKEELSLDTAFESSALEDIPDPEVRKALVEDVLDGLNQKNLINEEKIEENMNMAKNIYMDETVDKIDIPTTETSTTPSITESLENLNSTKSLEKLNENSSEKTLENVTELPEIKLDESTVINPEITKVSIENDSEFRQSRGLDNENVEKSLATNSNDIRRFKTLINIEGLSQHAQKILNLVKNRSGKTFTNKNNSENIINDDANIENNEENQKNINLEEINDTTDMTNIDNNETMSYNQQLNTENNATSDENLNIDAGNSVETNTIYDEKKLNSEHNLSEITTSKIEEYITTEKNIIEEKMVEGVTENTVLEEGVPNENELKINIELDNIKEKSIEHSSTENKKDISNENLIIDDNNTTVQIENMSDDIEEKTNDEQNTVNTQILKENVTDDDNSTNGIFIENSSSQNNSSESVERLEEVNDVENNINKKILEGNTTDEISNENSSSQSDNSESVENNNEEISKQEIILKTPSTIPLEQNSNSIETEIENISNNEEIIQGKFIEESSTTQIKDDWSEINENNISSDKIIENIENSFIEQKKTSIIEQNLNSPPTNENEIIESVDILDENTTVQPEIKSSSEPEPELNLDEETTTSVPIIVESTTTHNFKSKQEITKTLNEDIQETENSAIENIESQTVVSKIKSNKSYSSESSQSSESTLQIQNSTDSSSSEESRESSSTTENNLDTTTIEDIKNNKISKFPETTEIINTSSSSSSSSSEESSEERHTKNHKVKKSEIYDILRGNIKIKENTDNEHNNNSDDNLLSENNLLENVPAHGESLDLQQLLPRQVLDKSFLTENEDKKIFIQSDENENIPSLIFETTTILPIKIFNNTLLQLESVEKKRTFNSDEIFQELENDTTALTETLIEAAELTTELSRHIASFRSFVEADTEIPNETHETITFTNSDTMASSNIGKALPNHGLKSDIIQSNTSIVLLICITTVIMVIGLLAVTFYRYRGKHGTLDIQLEEQRHGKDDNDDDNDDDDDSETMSSLNDNTSSSATQSLKSNEKVNTVKQTNELSLLSKSQ